MLKAQGVSAGLAMKVGRGKARIHTLETEVSRHCGGMDKLLSDVKGEPSGPVSFFFLDLRCLFEMVGVMAWASQKDKLADEVVKSRDLGDSLQKEHEALHTTVDLVGDDLSLILEQEGSSLVVRATWIMDRAREIMRLALRFGIHQSFAITRSHYENIDLAALSQGYAPSYTNTQLDKIEKTVSSPA
jgi:hypothetical protein